MALKNFRAPPLPSPPAEWDRGYINQLIRNIEIFFSQLDAFTPNYAESYTADAFYSNKFIAPSRQVTASGNVADTDYLILADATGGAVTLTLPLAVISEGRTVVAKKLDASGNAVTFDGNGAETVDNAASVSTTTQYGALRVYCDGTEWWTV